MSDRPIQVGDLVQVIRSSHVCGEAHLGRIFAVEKMPMPNPGVECLICGAKNVALRNTPVVGFSCKPGKLGYMPASWVRRIPPLDELEGEKQKEDLREPA